MNLTHDPLPTSQQSRIVFQVVHDTSSLGLTCKKNTRSGRAVIKKYSTSQTKRIVEFDKQICNRQQRTKRQTKGWGRRLVVRNSNSVDWLAAMERIYFFQEKKLWKAWCVMHICW